MEFWFAGTGVLVGSHFVTGDSPEEIERDFMQIPILFWSADRCNSVNGYHWYPEPIALKQIPGFEGRPENTPFIDPFLYLPLP